MRHDPLSFRDSSSPARPVVIVDRPCGTGKTTEMINDLEATKRYLIVTPLLSECERIVKEAHVAVMQPEILKDDPEIGSKKAHLIELLETGHNVVTTHAMFNNLADVARIGLLDDYEIIIDEVMSVVDDGYRVKKTTWEELYVKAGYVNIDPETGLITPTELWVDNFEDVDDALRTDLYHAARTGRLYHLSDGINLAVMPEDLLKSGKSLRVYTYKAEGSIMYAYLKRIGLDPVLNKGSPQIERKFVRKARELITIKDIHALKGISLTYNSQTKTNSKKLDKVVPKALRSLKRRALSSVELSRVLITCPKVKWFRNGKTPKEDREGNLLSPFEPGPYALGSRMITKGLNGRGATWVPNTTRGTNDYNHCTHAIYLYDQNLNPSILNWFGGHKVISNEEYALTELIQWLWRTRVRKGEPVTVYLPSKRMRKLLADWLWEGQIPEVERRKLDLCQKGVAKKLRHECVSY